MRNWQCPLYSECLDIAAKANARSLDCVTCEYKNIRIPLNPPDSFEVEGLYRLLAAIFLKPIPEEPERVIRIRFAPELPISEWYIFLCSTGPPTWWDKRIVAVNKKRSRNSSAEALLKMNMSQPYILWSAQNSKSVD